jgi:hypothetical protein
VQKKANRAGATPLFGGQSAQKFCPGRSRPSLHSGSHVFFAKGKAASHLAVKFSSSGEVAFTPLLHRNLTCYFTLDRAHHYGNQSDESSRRTKLCAAQTAREAGATPPFDARCVTVAVWSLPPQGSENCTPCFSSERVLSDNLYAAPHTACPTRLHVERRQSVATLEVTTQTTQIGSHSNSR